MDWLCVCLGIVFCAFGICFALGKVHIHLSAWKNMPEEEKEKINITPLCRNIGEMILLNGILFLLNGTCEGFARHWFMKAMLAWFLVAGFDVWHISRSRRYQNK